MVTWWMLIYFGPSDTFDPLPWAPATPSFRELFASKSPSDRCRSGGSEPMPSTPLSAARWSRILAMTSHVHWELQSALTPAQRVEHLADSSGSWVQAVQVLYLNGMLHLKSAKAAPAQSAVPQPCCSVKTMPARHVVARIGQAALGVIGGLANLFSKVGGLGIFAEGALQFPAKTIGLYKLLATNPLFMDLSDFH
eukprot:s16_g34.t1